MEMKRCQKLGVDINAYEILSLVDTIIFDLDGTCWRGDKLLPGSVPLANRLLDMGKRICFITNNSTRTHDETVVELNHRGLPIRDKDQVLCTARATAFHLQQKYPNGGLAYCISPPSVEKELEDHGIKTWSCEEHNDWNAPPELIQDSTAVVCALDRTLNYKRLAIGTDVLLKREESLFVATNLDPTFPEHGGRLFPDCGAIVAALNAATGRPLDVNIGKPSSIMFEMAMERLNVNPARTLMVGDRCDTDIEFASAAGAYSMLVQTGAHSEKTAFKYRDSGEWKRAPNFIAESTNHFYSFMSEQ